MGLITALEALGDAIAALPVDHPCTDDLREVRAQLKREYEGDVQRTLSTEEQLSFDELFTEVCV